LPGNTLSHTASLKDVLASLQGKRILITGSSGFLGARVTRMLEAAGCRDLFLPRRAECDLVDRDAVRECYRQALPDIVVHLAARVGGIGANQERPADFLHDNLMMGVNLIDEGSRAGIEKFVQVGTVCSYPRVTATPFREETLWDGYPEATNAPYGLAKKVLLVQLQAYRAQYGLNGIYLLPANLYGPGDCFHLQWGHVIPAIIRKVVEAMEQSRPEIMLWGTGRATREFLYVDDAAEAICRATALYDDGEPVNVGTGHEISIRDLALLIARLAGFTGEIRFDHARPDGQPRRVLDIGRAKAAFGFSAAIPLEEGLTRTIAWYRANRSKGRRSGVERRRSSTTRT